MKLRATKQHKGSFRYPGMERDGLVDKVDIGDGKAHFELREDHHEHIRCDACGRVVGVPGCILENATAAVESDTGFTITSHQLLFSGICPECTSHMPPTDQR